LCAGAKSGLTNRGSNRLTIAARYSGTAINSIFNKSVCGHIPVMGHPLKQELVMRATKPKKTIGKPDYVLAPKELRPALRAIAKMKARTAPRLKLQNDDVRIDQPNRAVGQFVMMDALGVLAELTSASGSSTQTADETSLNFMLTVAGIKPNDRIETMIGAHIAVTHTTAMTAAQKLARSTNIVERESVDRTYNRLVRSFMELVERLDRRRRSAEPMVNVQNVSIGNDGQAVVGNVTQNNSAGSLPKSAVSPAAITDAPTRPMKIIGDPARDVIPAKRQKNRERQSSPHHRADAGKPALRGEDALRPLLSVAGGIRQKALPDAWRRAGFRRAEAEPKCLEAWRVHQKNGNRSMHCYSSRESF
jgi:hypothetical protein